MSEQGKGCAGKAGLQALVSIHDVMPETRSRVTDMLATLALPAQVVTLLVVPGRQWSRDDLAWLHGLQAAGHPLAGHGWIHQCQPPVTLYHRLHSALLSRQVAEHLSLSNEGIVRLVQDCHDWFGRHGLTVSSLYVPPAWALGRLERSRYRALPFRYVETLSGVLDTVTGQRARMPLVGFEADTGFRARFLALFNALSVARARNSSVPVRIGLHPFDLSCRLSRQIVPLLAQVNTFTTYDALTISECDARQSLTSRVGHGTSPE